MFLLSFIFVIVCGLFEWKQIYTGFFSYVYIRIPLGIQLSRGEGRVVITLTSLTQPHVCVCSPPGPGFLTSYVVVLYVLSLSSHYVFFIYTLVVSVYVHLLICCFICVFYGHLHRTWIFYLPVEWHMMFHYWCTVTKISTIQSLVSDPRL
jgi:hypothetical protein